LVSFRTLPVSHQPLTSVALVREHLLPLCTVARQTAHTKVVASEVAVKRIFGVVLILRQTLISVVVEVVAAVVVTTAVRMSALIFVIALAIAD
jgi:hypothetical protein